MHPNANFAFPCKKSSYRELLFSKNLVGAATYDWLCINDLLTIHVYMHAVLFIEQFFMEAYTQVEWAVNKILIQREW
jgi:hypothetical protein